MDNKTHHNRIVYANKTGGFSLLLALLVASVALSIGIALLGLTVKQLDLSVTARDSEIAFHAASGGIECLQWVRYDESDRLLNNGAIHNFTKTCMGATAAFNEDATDATDNRRVYYDVEVGGIIDGNPFCTNMDMIIVTPEDGDRGLEFDDGALSRTCPLGDACTIARAQGYNVECGQETTQFSVQRELTAEF